MIPVGALALICGDCHALLEQCSCADVWEAA